MQFVEVKKNEVKEFRADGHFSVLYANNKVYICSDDNFDSLLSSNEKHYKHDCSRCIFLGSWINNNKFDLYFCSQNGLPTVIARYGNKPQDYHSGLNMTGIKPLEVAKKIAKDFKLID